MMRPLHATLRWSGKDRSQFASRVVEPRAVVTVHRPPGTGSFFGRFNRCARLTREGRKMCLSPCGRDFGGHVVSAAKIGTVRVNGYRGPRGTVPFSRRQSLISGGRENWDSPRERLPGAEGDSPIFAAAKPDFGGHVVSAGKIGTVPVNDLRGSVRSHHSRGSSRGSTPRRLTHPTMLARLQHNRSSCYHRPWRSSTYGRHTRISLGVRLKRPTYRGGRICGITYGSRS